MSVCRLGVVHAPDENPPTAFGQPCPCTVTLRWDGVSATWQDSVADWLDGVSATWPDLISPDADGRTWA